MITRLKIINKLKDRFKIFITQLIIIICEFLSSPLVIKTMNAYHLYGKPGNSGENTNGTVHPGGNFLGKKEYLSRYYRFPVFSETTKIFCSICLDY